MFSKTLEVAGITEILESGSYENFGNYRIFRNNEAFEGSLLKFLKLLQFAFLEVGTQLNR
jgi:hypothetical protein